MTDTMVTHADGATIGDHAHKRRYSLRNLFVLRTKIKITIAMGMLSAVLYFGLYHFNSDIRHIAEMTNQGDKTYFLLPIGLAFVFSFVHGIFTDRFWEALGVKAKR